MITPEYSHSQSQHFAVINWFKKIIGQMRGLITGKLNLIDFQSESSQRSDGQLQLHPGLMAFSSKQRKTTEEASSSIKFKTPKKPD